MIRRHSPGLALTFDPVEHRGFEYQSGMSFVLFAGVVRGELGRGGRYRTQSGEAATGFTLYTDTLLRALPRPRPANRLLIDRDLSSSTAADLRRQGWVTIAALSKNVDVLSEARRLGCSHAWIDGEPHPVELDR